MENENKLNAIVTITNILKFLLKNELKKTKNDKKAILFIRMLKELQMISFQNQ